MVARVKCDGIWLKVGFEGFLRSVRQGLNRDLDLFEAVGDPNLRFGAF